MFVAGAGIWLPLLGFSEFVSVIEVVSYLRFAAVVDGFAHRVRVREGARADPAGRLSGGLKRGVGVSKAGGSWPSVPRGE
jgi:hypothetical protein